MDVADHVADQEAAGRIGDERLRRVRQRRRCHDATARVEFRQGQVGAVGHGDPPPRVDGQRARLEQPLPPRAGAAQFLVGPPLRVEGQELIAGAIGQQGAAARLEGASPSGWQAPQKRAREASPVASSATPREAKAQEP